MDIHSSRKKLNLLDIEKRCMGGGGKGRGRGGRERRRVGSGVRRVRRKSRVKGRRMRRGKKRVIMRSEGVAVAKSAI